VRWIHIGMKDLRITTRDRGALGILIGMPMLLIVILGSALGNLNSNISKIPVAIVNLDKGDTAAKITDPFFENETLTKLFLAQRSHDPAAARAAVERGDLAGALVLPSDLTKRIAVGKPATMTLYVDPGRQITSGIFRGVAETDSARTSGAIIGVRTTSFYISRIQGAGGSVMGSAIGQVIRSVTSTSGAQAVGLAETTATAGKEVSTLSYYAGAMSAMFIMFGAMFGAFSLIRERETWTLPRMLTTPASRMDIVGGKMLGVFAIGILQFGVLVAFTSAIGVTWGDPLAVGLIAVSTVGAATGMSLLIASVAKTVRSVSGIAQIVIQLMAALGGSFIPVTQFPAFMRPLHYFTVNGWAIDGILQSMRGGTALSILPNVGALLAMAVVFFVVGATRLRWE
jgi:ABC-2 type transport system permease protein